MRLLSDETLNGNIVGRLFLRQPSLGLLRVQDVNLLHVLTQRSPVHENRLKSKTLEK